MHTNSKTTFDELLERARRGTDADWEYIDKHLTPEIIQNKDFFWAKDEARRKDSDNVRDFAATTLMVVKTPFDLDLNSRLADWMMEDSSHIVRFRLAMALYGHGDRTQRTCDILKEACDDPEVGHLARRLRNAAT